MRINEKLQKNVQVLIKYWTKQRNRLAENGWKVISNEIIKGWRGFWENSNIEIKN